MEAGWQKQQLYLEEGAFKDLSCSFWSFLRCCWRSSAVQVSSCRKFTHKIPCSGWLVGWVVVHQEGDSITLKEQQQRHVKYAKTSLSLLISCVGICTGMVSVDADGKGGCTGKRFYSCFWACPVETAGFGAGHGFMNLIETSCQLASSGNCCLRRE